MRTISGRRSQLKLLGGIKPASANAYSSLVFPAASFFSHLYASYPSYVLLRQGRARRKGWLDTLG
jgi:hypothetical protein